MEINERLKELDYRWRDSLVKENGEQTAREDAQALQAAGYIAVCGLLASSSLNNMTGQKVIDTLADPVATSTEAIAGPYFLSDEFFPNGISLYRRLTSEATQEEDVINSPQQ